MKNFSHFILNDGHIPISHFNVLTIWIFLCKLDLKLESLSDMTIVFLRFMFLQIAPIFSRQPPPLLVKNQSNLPCNYSGVTFTNPQATDKLLPNLCVSHKLDSTCSVVVWVPMHNKKDFFLTMNYNFFLCI